MTARPRAPLPRIQRRRQHRRGRRRRANISAPWPALGHAAAIKRDRAAVAATALLQIVGTAPPEQLRQQIEDYLRSEFADTARQAANDRCLAD